MSARSVLGSLGGVFCVVLFACAKATDPLPDDDGGAGDATQSDTGPCTVMCGGKCSDPKSDSANCGKCGTVCPMGATCVQGNCQCTAIDGGSTTKCGAVCVDTKADNTNCGKCGNLCGNDAGPILGGGTWACQNGTCGIQCPGGDGGAKTECSGACVDTKTDNDNCGTCANACVAMTEQCVEGLCCKQNETVCPGGDGGSPACTNTQTDSQNCGKCGMKCSGQTPNCNAGTCVACGNDCWGPSGCLTQGGHCIQFTCRAGNAPSNFCNGCKGWSEVSYNDWMNGGYCGDVIKSYRTSNQSQTKCGSAPTCCGSAVACAGSDNAWHFSDGATNHVTGPCIGCANDVNCAYWNFTDSSAYTRISVCKLF